MTRAMLPNRRPCETFSFAHDGTNYTATVGRYFPSGAPGEVFLSGGKPGSAVETVARDAAVAVSLALQHGAPLDTLRAAMTRLDDGQPAGPMGRLLEMVSP